MVIPTLREYWDQLRAHDWNWAYTDNQRIWDAGKINQRRLEELRTISDRYCDLFNAWSSHKSGLRKRPPSRPRA